MFGGSAPSLRRGICSASRLIRAASENSPTSCKTEAWLLADASVFGCPAPSPRRGPSSSWQLIRATFEDSPCARDTGIGVDRHRQCLAADLGGI